MRDSDSSARATRRFASTNAFVIRTAKRLSATGSGHASALNPQYHFKDDQAWDTANYRDYHHWIGRGGVSKQGIAPRCFDRNGCFGQKAFMAETHEGITVSHLIADADELIEDAGHSIVAEVHHVRSRLMRCTNKMALGRTSRKRAHKR